MTAGSSRVEWRGVDSRVTGHCVRMSPGQTSLALMKPAWGRESERERDDDSGSVSR